jgi:release factor glutamine methyltransferase
LKRALCLYAGVVTILEAIQRSTEFLAKRGVESPRLQVEWLAAHVLKLPRLKLYLDFERELAEAELAALREVVRRRGNREPLQHVLGTAVFCGLELEVDARVLIPRPETELLAERAWRHLLKLSMDAIGSTGQAASSFPLTRPSDTLPPSEGGRVSEGRVRGALASAPPVGSSEHEAKRSVTALDFGTGSGCLAISIAAKCPAARIHAVDVSSDALTVAQQNAVRHGVAERIHFRCGDGFAALPSGLRFDLIVANPPYIPRSEIATLEPEVRDHDPRPAWDGGPDGLCFFRLLAREGGAWLHSGGVLMLECGDGQTEPVRDLLVTARWVVEVIENDLARRPRFVVARWNEG